MDTTGQIFILRRVSALDLENGKDRFIKIETIEKASSWKELIPKIYAHAEEKEYTNIDTLFNNYQHPQNWKFKAIAGGYIEIIKEGCKEYLITEW